MTAAPTATISRMVSVPTPTTSPCNLCPRRCGARRDEGERGYCGAGAAIEAARAALHHWEEPPISGRDGSGTVFFTHCPLHCCYCQNAPLAAGERGWEVSPGRLAELCLDLQDQGALNVNFVTPTHYSLAIRDAVALARARGFALPVVWNTSGYEEPDTLEALAGTVDAYLADYKYGDAALARRYSQAPDYPEVALKAIGAMAAQVGPPAYDTFRGQRRLVRGVVVRHLLLPGALEQSKEALRRLYGTLGDSVAYSLMNQYTPAAPPAVLQRFPELAAAVPDDRYEELLDFADGLGMDGYFWQEGPAADESFIPRWDGRGIIG